jgi:hypothetical protein
MLTRKEILEEYAKCLVDPVYAIETYLETFDKTQESIVQFKLFPKQKEIIEAYTKHRRNIVTKPRQAGVSTTTAAFMAITIALADVDNPESILIIANKQELAIEFLSKIKDFLTQLPRWFWGTEFTTDIKKSIFTGKDSQKEIGLPNRSRVKAVATSKDALRGFTPTYLIMDEAAYIDNGKEVFGAAQTSLGSGGKTILISTPNGMDELYYTTYNKAKKKENDFNVIEMKWYQDLRYNKNLKWVKKYKEIVDDVEVDKVEEIIETEFTFTSFEAKILEGYKPTSPWYEEMCRSLNNDSRMIAQELDVSFIGSGGNVISETDIEFQELHNVKNPVRVWGPESEFWQWADPVPGHEYILGSDVSRGDGNDDSTIEIVDITLMEQVFEFKGKMPPDELGKLVKTWGDIYSAYAVVDITGGIGVTTILKLIELGYKRLHYDTPNGKIFANEQSAIYNHKKDNKVPGLTINGIRTPLISNFEEKIRNNVLKVRSIRATTEMKTFIFKNGRADHMTGFHDDCLFGLAMILWVYEHSFKNLEKAKEQTKAMLQAWTGISIKEVPLDNDLDKGTGFVAKNNKNKVAQPKPNFSPFTARNMQDPTGKYLWLFSGTK